MAGDSHASRAPPTRGHRKKPDLGANDAEVGFHHVRYKRYKHFLVSKQTSFMDRLVLSVTTYRTPVRLRSSRRPAGWPTGCSGPPRTDQHRRCADGSGRCRRGSAQRRKSGERDAPRRSPDSRRSQGEESRRVTRSKEAWEIAIQVLISYNYRLRT